MNKFGNLLGKEIRELLTIKMILPFAISLLVLVFVGQMMKQEGKKTSYAADVMITDFDRTKASANAIKVLQAAGFTVKLMEPAPLESLVKEVVGQDGSVFIAIPAGFEQGILLKKGTEVEFYSIIRSLGLRESIREKSARGIVSTMNKGISDNYINEMDKNVDPSLIKNPVRANEYVYLKGRITKGSGRDVIAFITMQTIFIPVILFILIIFAGTMIASSMALEKENKTLETLLTVPISRFSIVAAKMTAAMILAGVFAGIFLIGFGSYMANMSSVAAQDMNQLQEAVDNLPMGFGITLDFKSTLLIGIGIFLSIILALLIATLLALFTQEVKDVQAAIMPLMLMIMIPYFFSIMMDPQTMSLPLKIFIFLIPFSHTFFAFKYLLLGEITPVLWGILYVAFFTFILLFITVKVFSSDKILTMKFSLGKRKKQLKTA